MKHRGFGRVYQPTYKNKQTGEVRKSQTYWLCYYVHGHRIIESANTNKEAVANRLLKERTGRAAIGQPVGPQIERTTIDDLLKLVTDDYIANSRRSLDRVEDALPHLRDHFGADCKARDITEEGLTAYQAHRREEGAKPSTINYELAILRRGFSLGRKRVASHPEFQMLHVDNVRKGFFEREQYEAVLHQLPEYQRPVVIVTYITGWRTQSELLTRNGRILILRRVGFVSNRVSRKMARGASSLSHPSCARCSRDSVSVST
jgi:hypothetical protein